MKKLFRRRAPGGAMPLMDHLKELRNRVFVSALAIALATIPAWFIYQPLLTLLSQPMVEAGGQVNFAQITDPFIMQLQTSVFVAFIATSPLWTYQIWAFIVPALSRREKWTSVAFVLAAVPLFLLGCFLGYQILPGAVGILLGFVPEGSSSIIAANDYLTFVARLVLAFGIAFLMPVLLVALSMTGIVTSRQLLKGWRFAVVIMFILGAVLTPTPDPWNMCLLSIPLCLLYFLAVGVAALLERMRKRRQAREDAESAAVTTS